ncbi:putative Cystatin domain-containing protein [Helianthus annuus]|uniref:Cysteine proteinase inhibitor n=1 Tax=Helianthus annuus TaxID=4232 RepID=A0A9K3NX27_HELAN|nr:multicystatin [Helianthus annuus]XP_022029980.1 multicystatin [Helianthus annuus]KAF5816517.1 putative Cystatin domain-containing protein [Helianthus annuus]KAJ0603056.1 putative Cystatin domain-containing protein [Helianthus annuus]KAJ0629518.1 putative Cystatin domain-containing protein [Helianthus annuus]
MSVVGEDNLKKNDLAPIAVDIYNVNREQYAQLEFWKVLHVDDLMITITLKAAADNGRLMNTYEAKVLVELEEFRDLTGVDVPGVDTSDLSNKLARFAVHEHNREQNASLELWKVVKREDEIFDDRIMYCITLKAVDGGPVGTYYAKVLVTLKDFQILGAATSA